MYLELRTKIKDRISLLNVYDLESNQVKEIIEGLVNGMDDKSQINKEDMVSAGMRHVTSMTTAWNVDLACFAEVSIRGLLRDDWKNAPEWMNHIASGAMEYDDDTRTWLEMMANMCLSARYNKFISRRRGHGDIQVTPSMSRQ
jgi:hypothetical protein